MDAEQPDQTIPTQQPEINIDYKKINRRRDLLPWWVIACIWLFLAFFVVMPVGIIFMILNIDFNLSLLGLQTNTPLSVPGLLLMALFSFKGVVAFGLWTEKRWAINLAKIDAIISIAVCCVTMVLSLLGHGFTLRLELILIILYYIKMNKIEYDWVNFNEQIPETM